MLIKNKKEQEDKMHRVNNISKLESKLRYYKDIEINDISNEQITNINKIKYQMF